MSIALNGTTGIVSANISNGTILPVDLDSSIALSFVPTGAIIACSFSATPSGYLFCDGSGIDKTTYFTLWSAIGYNYGGSGDTFYLPDYRGYFLRGQLGTGAAARDPDSASRTDRGDGTTGNNVGTIQQDEFESHTHSIGTGGNGSGYLGGGTQTGSFPAGTQNPLNVLIIANTGGNETRPRNIYVRYHIKY